MIKYSIVMRSVNANLFDINQAKSRIKAAEKAGQTPSSEDVALEGHRDRYIGSLFRNNEPVRVPRGAHLYKGLATFHIRCSRNCQ